MTVKEKLIDLLVAKGLFPSQTEEILELTIPQISDVGVVNYNSPSEDYPDSFYTVYFCCMKPVALKWIDDNKPEAWCRAMFV